MKGQIFHDTILTSSTEYHPIIHKVLENYSIHDFTPGVENIAEILGADTNSWLGEIGVGEDEISMLAEPRIVAVP